MTFFEPDMLALVQGPSLAGHQPKTAKTKFNIFILYLCATKDLGDGDSNQGFGDLQLGSRPGPEIIYFWGLNGPGRFQTHPKRWGDGPPPPF